jgi:ankyrin repeat protein
VNYYQRIITDIECHAVESIRECFANGVNPNGLHNNEPLIYELTSEYGRTPNFKECVQAFIEAGLQFDSPELLAVLSDDADTLGKLLQADPNIAHNRYTLRCAFTPLLNATLLHVCAEFNHTNCAQELLKYRSDVNAKAGIDEHGFGGQTPIFHTVNQPQNNSSDMMNLLLAHNADVQLTVTGIIWGKSYPWETFIPSVNPISYAMMGLLPQMHRRESTVTEVISMLMKYAYNVSYMPGNVPNAYLKK